MFDAGEPGLAGVKLNLIGAGPDGELGTPDDVNFPSKTTDSSGAYDFTGLQAGNYRLDLDESTAPPNLVTTENDPLDISISISQDYDAADFGLARPEWVTLDINPAAVTTFAGNGTDATFDGLGIGASFRDMGGVVVFGGYIYVGTEGSIRRANLVTGEVSTLAGHPTATGCTNSSDPTQVRFMDIYDVATDGIYAYTVGPCAWVRRTSLQDGATTADLGFAEGYQAVALGPDGYLYAARSGNVDRIDVSNGQVTVFHALEIGYNGREANPLAITVDESAVWVIFEHRVGYSTYVRRIRKIPLDGAASSLFLETPDYFNSLESAGNYLYLSRGGGRKLTLIRQYNKVAPSWKNIAGTSAQGFVDGTGTDAWFSDVKGIASDGNNLWVADSGNYRLRKLTAGGPLPASQPSSAITTVSINPAAVTTFAGNGSNSTFDGTGSGASFRDMGGAVVVGNFVYVGTKGSLRKVNIATGEVSTLAGHPSEDLCSVDSPDPSQVRFGNTSDIATDGYYIYSSGCGLRRTSIATGATSSIPANVGPEITFGPDGYIYTAIANPDADRIDVFRIHPINGTSSLLTTIGSYNWSLVTAITSDATHLWVAASVELFLYSTERRIFKVSLADGGWSQFAATSGSFSAMESAGDFLYVGSGSGVWGGTLIRRYSKSDGSAVTIAGSDIAGYSDDPGSFAQFADIEGIASDGTNLWVADGGNHRLRVSADLGLVIAGGWSFGWDGYGAWTEDVNAPLGNFVNTNSDLEIETPGPDLGLTRSYNSLDTRIGGFGQGWTYNYEMIWKRVGENAIAILFPDGRREFHTKNADGTYSPPAGYFSKLTPDGSGFKLKAKDGTTYGLRSDGKLGSITDDNGQLLDLAYDGSGNLTTVTDQASSRKLTFTWSNGYVASVSTDSIAAHGGLLTWKYYYSGNKLVKACDPRNNSETGSCITYTYTGQKLSLIAKPRGNTEVEVAYQSDGKVDWRKDGLGNLTNITYVSNGVVDVTDPRGNATRQEYDSKYRLTKETDPDGGITTYTYDAKGNRNQITDPNGNVSSMTYDERGNLLTQTDPEGKIRYFTYDSSDNMTASRDPRSSSATDNTYLTTYEYDSAGNKTKETTPPTTDFSPGVIKNWTHTNGSEAAVGGGTMPPGLLRTESDAKSKVTTYSYDSKGDLRKLVDRVGSETTYTYDEIGRRLTDTQTSDTFPLGVTTSYAYDVMSNVVSETSAAVTNKVTLSSHRAKITRDYDANSNMITQTVSDLVGGDISRVTTFTYDANDRQTSSRDPEGGTISRTFDAAGNVSAVTDQEGRVTLTSYNQRNLPVTVTVKDFVDDPIAGSTPRDLVLQVFGYDAAGRKTSETDALGRRREFTYDKADRVSEIKLKSYDNRDATTRDIVLEANAYDAAGNLTRQVTSGIARTDHAYDAAGRKTTSTFDPDGINRITTFNYDENGNLVKTTSTDGTRTEEVRFAYDDGDRKTAETIENGSQDVITTFTYDKRGLLVAKVDPRGNVTGANAGAFTTGFENDELGRLVRTIFPEVVVETGGGAPTSTHPESLVGYNSFSDVTHTKDQRGQTTTKTYDKLSRVVEITHPIDVNLDGVTTTATEAYVYDGVGNLTSSTDRRSETTDFTFDKLNRVVHQLDPLVTGQSQRGATRHTYDDGGNRTSVVDQVGAKTEWTYDDLDRVRTETKVVRRPSAPSDLFTTTFDYDDLGNQTYRSDPLGNVTTATYSAASERLTEVDELGKTTSYRYDVSSKVTRETDPLGRFVEYVYDLAGRKTEEKMYNSSGILLTTTSFGNDAVGNQTSVTTPRGYATNLTYDALSRVSQIVEPISASSSITTTYGYDEGGNLTRFTDGEGRSTILAYQAWGLTEKVIEPSTASHPALGDRTWGNIYDAGGLLIEERQPGGVTITRSFDELGRLTSESGSGAGTTPASRSFGYDLAGSKTSATHPTSGLSFQYDDRKLLTQSSGGAGTAFYTFDAAGRLTGKTDAAGTHAYVWNARGDLDQASDPLSATTLDFTFNDTRQVTGVSYGTGSSAPTRTYGYDDLGRATSDVLKDGSGVTQTSFAYSYDLDGNLIGQEVSLPSNLLSGTHTYTYDHSGRLTSWTRPGLTGPTTDSYVWDKAGNRTQAGAATYTYDQRNRLISAVEPAGGILPSNITRAFTYTPRGTLSEITDGVTPEGYTFDALGRLVGYSKGVPVSYDYDGLDRIALRSGNSFSYSGFEIDPTSDGTFTFSRSPAGRLLSLKKGIQTSLAGLNRHGDLSYLFDGTAQISDTKVYDPFGKVASETGTTAATLGFQGDFTDPASSKVWMGARWYGGNDANFLSRDSVFGQLRTPITLNRYTYAQGDPLSFFDPDGHFSFRIGDWGRKFGSLFSSKRSSAARRLALSSMTAARQAIKTQHIQMGRSQHRIPKGISRAHASSGSRYSGVEFLKDVGGVFKGIGEGVVDTVKGVKDLAVGTGKFIYRGTVECARGRASCYEQEESIRRTASYVRERKLGVFKDIASAATEAIRTDWKQGNQGEAIGRGIAAIGEAIVGTKGLGKLSKLRKLDNLPTAPRSALGDLRPAEVRQIQAVVNDAGRPLEVVGSAARGRRRGVGTDLPIGKGPGTRSDIDYLVPHGSLPHYETTGLYKNLPDLDRIIPGVHNPHIGPAVRFEPWTDPFFVPGAPG